MRASTVKRVSFVLSLCILTSSSIWAAETAPKLNLEDLGVKIESTRPNLELQAQREKRSSMLKTHQTMAFITWALMAGAVALSGNTRENNSHQIVGTAAGLSYYTTAYFSMFAPDPDHISGKSGLNIKIHKTLRWVHLPLMVLLPFAAAQAQHQIRNHEHLHGLGSYKGAIGAGAFVAYSLAGSVMLFEF